MWEKGERENRQEDSVNKEAAKEKERIVQKLKDNGCRITKQRLEILDVILEKRCTSCKEIFFYASRRDDRIGIATGLPHGGSFGGGRRIEQRNRVFAG